MSIKRIVANGVETAFRAAGDLVDLGALKIKSNNIYDPETDESTGHVTLPNIRMIRTTVSEKDLEVSPVAVTDVKFLVPAKDLGMVVPTTVDQIIHRSVFYNVLKAVPVTGDSLWIFYARRS